MIVATAGHVDHGKTRLVKALTAIDTDRLPEEKRRGLTIEPGFACWRPGEGPAIAFVDVPGHERFIHNMLGGITGIDMALLVVAADDGPMPQTREHLAILELLGVRRGAVALSKIDRVPPARIEEASRLTRALLARTAWSEAPLFACSASTGEGMAALASHLVQLAGRLAPRPVEGHFRLPVDRAFTLAGAGLVVTGTAVSGRVAVGDTVHLLRAGLQARVRSIHAHDTPAGQALAGQRCALNLAGPGLHRAAIARGDWVACGDPPAPASRLDARLQALPDLAQPLAHWTGVHVHIGAAHVTGRVAVLGAQAIEPGASGWVQLVLDAPVAALRGDRFIVRDASARQTLGGGAVVDVFPPARGRARPARLAFLEGMALDGHEAALRALLAQAREGLDLRRFAANRNLLPSHAAEVQARVPMKALPCGLGFAPGHWAEGRARVLAALAEWHRRSPDRVGPAADRVLSGQAGPPLPREAVLALVNELAGEGALVREITGVRLPSHRPQLRPADAALWQRVRPLLEGGGLRPPSVAELAQALGEDAAHLETALSRLAHHGVLARVARNRFYPLPAMERLVHLLNDEQAERGEVTAAGFRDRSGIGRNHTIEVLEYFDRVGLTRRNGAARTVQPFPGRDTHPGGAPGLQSR